MLKTPFWNQRAGFSKPALLMCLESQCGALAEGHSGIPQLPGYSVVPAELRAALPTLIEPDLPVGHMLRVFGPKDGNDLRNIKIRNKVTGQV